jgi:hypothetical protein
LSLALPMGFALLAFATGFAAGPLGKRVNESNEVLEIGSQGKHLRRQVSKDSGSAGAGGGTASYGLDACDPGRDRIANIVLEHVTRLTSDLQ